MKDITKKFTKALKDGRKEYCMTQQEVGDELLISQRCVGEYERGEHLPSIERAEDLLNAVGYRFEIVPITV